MGPWWQDQCCCFWGEQWNQNLNKNSEEKITVDKFQYRFIFQVDAKVWLRGIGLYGAKDGSKFTVNIKVKYRFQNNYLSDVDWWYKRLNNNLLHIEVIFEQQMLASGSINPITLQHYRCSWTTTAYSRRPGSTRPTTVPPLSSSSFPNLSRSNPTRGVIHWSNKNKSGIHFTALLWRRTDLQIRHNDRANRRAHLIRPERTKGANQWSCNFLTDLKMVNFDFLWLWCFSRKVVSSTGASGSTFDVTFFTSPLGVKPDLFSLLLTTFGWYKKESDPSWFVRLRSKWGRNWDGPASCSLLQVFISFICNFYTWSKIERWYWWNKRQLEHCREAFFYWPALKWTNQQND